MGQHRRKPRRRMLGPTLLTGLSALTVAALVVGSHTLASHVTAVGSPSTVHPLPPAPAAAVPAPAGSTLPSPAPSSAGPAATATPATATPATGATSAGASATPSVPAAEPGTTAVAPATAEAATVGALFAGAVAAGNHFCTASVLDSPTGNLLLTAAHCLDGTAGVTFAPGYRDGRAPYGTWRVTAIHTTDGWSRDGDQDEDFAILETAAADGRRIEDVVGANRLGTDEPFGATVRLYGYPGDSESPVLCTNTTSRHSTYQRAVDCPGYPGGTSGGPWISTATGHVIGIIGGFQEGGDTEDTSYDAYFDHTIAALYAEAVAAAS
ncbi:serine protease [Kitasatospora sp. A2-31]|uniref:trypsin-like serine peptidase n=1 Tax=Kitasatospora sp. A2-31 TaxID=2916414 RepID=UPI001EE9C702|nr:serine protease [Kitasatospora sp. A2-31]MCG6498651.1 serine protease [Kitasatospora sp. A2-31]